MVTFVMRMGRFMITNKNICDQVTMDWINPCDVQNAYLMPYKLPIAVEFRYYPNKERYRYYLSVESLVGSKRYLEYVLFDGHKDMHLRDDFYKRAGAAMITEAQMKLESQLIDVGVIKLGEPFYNV